LSGFSFFELGKGGYH